MEACLQTVRAVGLAVEARLASARAGPGAPADGELRVSFDAKREIFTLHITRSHLSYAMASGFIQQARAAKRGWVLFVPYVPPRIGSHLAANGVSYVDAVGNCHLVLPRGHRLLAHVEGKRPAPGAAEGAGLRLPGYQLVFAVLAQPGLLKQSVRAIAKASGTSKSATADQLRRLGHQGLVDRKAGLITRPRDLRDRWLAAYPDVVRPAWLRGRYRIQSDDPEQLERRLADVLGDAPWALGGGAAAWRLTRFYRGPDTVLHVPSMPADLPRRLAAIADPEGALAILETPGEIAYAGGEAHLAHPLLIYSEMATSTDPRMIEAAGELRTRYRESDAWAR